MRIERWQRVCGDLGTRRMLKARKLVRDLETYLQDQSFNDTYDLKKFLGRVFSETRPSHAWKFLGSGVYKCVYGCKSENFVVKIGGIAEWEIPDSYMLEEYPENFSPKVQLHYVHAAIMREVAGADMAGDPLFIQIQRRVTLTRDYKTVEHLRYIGASTSDMHSGNVGVWKNRPVIIDL